MNKKTLFFVQAALIAALYATLTILQNTLFPGSASAAIQFRVSEVLCVLAVFTPAAIPGLTVGCVIANISSLSTLGPYDLIFGSIATLLATCAMYLLRNAKVWKIPLFALFMPALFNAVIVGAEIEAFFIEGPFNFTSFLIQALCVGAGELGVCLVLGIPFYFAVLKSGIMKRFELKQE